MVACSGCALAGKPLVIVTLTKGFGEGSAGMAQGSEKRKSTLYAIRA